MTPAELSATLCQAGQALDDTTVDRLYKYLKLLLLWSERINLTGTKGATDLVRLHIADSLHILPHLPSNATSLVDVGSGAGLPGLVIAAARPELAVTLVEPTAKKHAFLRTAARELGLGLVSARRARIEDVEDGQFDVATSRATWPVPDWLDLGRRLVRPGGLVLGMEGRDQYPLPPAAARHPYSLFDMPRAIVVLPLA